MKKKDIEKDFTKPINIIIRSSGFFKNQVEERAKELGTDMSKYIRGLVKSDIKNKKK